MSAPIEAPSRLVLLRRHVRQQLTEIALSSSGSRRARRCRHTRAKSLEPVVGRVDGERDGPAVVSCTGALLVLMISDVIRKVGKSVALVTVVRSSRPVTSSTLASTRAEPPSTSCTHVPDVPHAEPTIESTYRRCGQPRPSVTTPISTSGHGCVDASTGAPCSGPRRARQLLSAARRTESSARLRPTRPQARTTSTPRMAAPVRRRPVQTPGARGAARCRRPAQAA